MADIDTNFATAVGALIKAVRARLAALEYDSGLREIGHLTTGLTSGTIRIRVWRGWAQMTLVDARFEAGGTLTVFNSGGQLAPWAPETPGADVRGWALDASTGLTYRAEAANSGAIYLRNVPANKTLQGSIVWPFTRTPPTTPIGNPI